MVSTITIHHHDSDDVYFVPTTATDFTLISTSLGWLSLHGEILYSAIFDITGNDRSRMQKPHLIENIEVGNIDPILSILDITFQFLNYELFFLANS
jgi:hypothetical protein